MLLVGCGKFPLTRLCAKWFVFCHMQLSTTTECSGDDFDCYWRAQQALLRTINRYGDNGCTVILTGDYHISDFRVRAVSPPFCPDLPHTAPLLPFTNALTTRLLAFQQAHTSARNTDLPISIHSKTIRPCASCLHLPDRLSKNQHMCSRCNSNSTTQ